MDRIGDLPELKRLTKRVLKFDLTQATEKMLKAATAVRQEDATDKDKAYLSRFFVQCTLPHSNPGNVTIWKRRNGHLILSIKPGTDSDTGKSLGIPYGSLPRLLLFWMTTEAKQTGKRRLYLGSSLTNFMLDVGLTPSGSGGKNSETKRLRRQMERLFRATISIDVNTTSGGPKRMLLVGRQSPIPRRFVSQLDRAGRGFLQRRDHVDGAVRSAGATGAKAVTAGARSIRAG